MDLGAIYGSVELNTRPFDEGLKGVLGKLKSWASKSSEEADKGGTESGKKWSSGFSKTAVAGLATGGAMVASAFAMAVVKGINLQPAGAKVAAQLNLTKEEAARAADAAGKVYSANWGASMEDAAQRTGVVISSVRGRRAACLCRWR